MAKQGDFEFDLGCYRKAKRRIMIKTDFEFDFDVDLQGTWKLRHVSVAVCWFEDRFQSTTWIESLTTQRMIFPISCTCSRRFKSTFEFGDFYTHRDSKMHFWACFILWVWVLWFHRSFHLSTVISLRGTIFWLPLILVSQSHKVLALSIKLCWLSISSKWKTTSLVFTTRRSGEFQGHPTLFFRDV